MKLVKLSIVALSMGLFVASCGNSEATKTTTTDSAATMTAAPAPDTTAAPAAAPVADSTKMVDTAKKMETKMETKKTETKMETKKTK